MTLADRVNLLHEEIGRLAHASPPPAGREAAIRQLKGRVTVLRYEQHARGTRPIREGLRQVLTLGVIGLLIGVVRPLMAAARGRPPQAQELGTFREHLMLAWAASAICIFLWLIWKRWREIWALREALVYTDELQRRLQSNDILGAS